MVRVGVGKIYFSDTLCKFLNHWHNFLSCFAETSVMRFDHNTKEIQHQIKRKISWKDQWEMEAGRISFLLRAIHNILPSSINLHQQLGEDPANHLCSIAGTLRHIITGSKVNFSQGSSTAHSSITNSHPHLKTRPGTLVQHSMYCLLCRTDSVMRGCHWWGLCQQDAAWLRAERWRQNRLEIKPSSQWRLAAAASLIQTGIDQLWWIMCGCGQIQE